MRWVLMLIVFATTIADALQLEFSLAPGLSLKNLLLYAAAGVLILRAIVVRDLRLQYPAMQGAFTVLVLYAIVSWVALSFVLQVPGYEVVANAITLKSNFVDYLVFFLVFFYGARNSREALQVVFVLMAAVALANLLTVTNVAGLTAIGEVSYGNEDDYEGGRIHGVFGHANETGAIIALLLPFYIAAIESTRGIFRIGWYGALAASLGMLLLTGSRGALAGLALGAVPAMLALRRYLQARRVLFWLGWSAAVAVPGLVFFGGQYFETLMGRLRSQSVTGVSDASSGRTDLWWQGISTMFDAPYSLLTGFGWGAWNEHGFIYVAHNQYLWIGFELGLIGLALYFIVLGLVGRQAVRALPTAPPSTRPYLFAFVVGFSALLVTMFFENMYKPSLYMWPLFALMMRCAAEAGELRVARVRSPIGAPSRSASPARRLSAR